MNKSVLWMSLALSLLIIGVAFGMYDPQTGRFLQRDSLGTGPQVVFTGGGPRIIGTKGPFVPGGTSSNLNQFIDGMNLYEYVKSNPIMLTDPTGGCSSEDPHGERDPEGAQKARNSCKCFCIESFTFNGRKSNHMDIPFYGGFIELEMKGKWVDFKDGNPGRDGRAEVHWWEWYTVPGNLDVYDGQPSKTWNDLQSIRAPQPFGTVYSYNDSPGVRSGGPMHSIDQEAYIMAAAKTHRDCPCPYNNQKIFYKGASLRLDGMYNSMGFTGKHEFKIYHDTKHMPHNPSHQRVIDSFGPDRF